MPDEHRPPEQRGPAPVELLRKPPAKRPQGHYRVGPHPTVRGLLAITWIVPGVPRDSGSFYTIDPSRVALLRKALEQWERQEPDSQEVDGDGASQ